MKSDEIFRRLQSLSIERKEEFSATLTWFIAERLVVRLGKSRWRDQVLLYRDLQIFSVVGNGPPFEWRAEFMWRAGFTAEKVLDAFNEICQIEAMDTMVLNLAASHDGVPILRRRVDQYEIYLIAQLGGMKLPFRFTLHAVEVLEKSTADFYFKSVLGEGYGVRSLTIHPIVLLSEIIHEIVQQGMALSRIQVYFDAVALIEASVIDLDQMREALLETFSKRCTPIPVTLPLAMSDRYAIEKSKNQLVQAYLMRSRVTTQSFTGIVGKVRDLIWPCLLNADQSKTVVIQRGSVGTSH